jgi:hypothetical protein
MSTNDPERISMAFVFDVTSPRFSRRGFMKTVAFLGAAGFAAAACGSSSDSGSATDSDEPEPKVLKF